MRAIRKTPAAVNRRGGGEEFALGDASTWRRTTPTLRASPAYERAPVGKVPPEPV